MERRKHKSNKSKCDIIRSTHLRTKQGKSLTISRHIRFHEVYNTSISLKITNEVNHLNIANTTSRVKAKKKFPLVKYVLLQYNTIFYLYFAGEKIPKVHQVSNQVSHWSPLFGKNNLKCFKWKSKKGKLFSLIWPLI